ncbi:hypothetical protein H206_00972 [Candidatus Electrothrix aarhusensis]|uniref:RACo C-terminal domain-containing protein n=1 Tax=Candidatus Electrothrix aarhusensis TaxID=1859131 RepID=A0A444IX45_9BACT|nr:hypothetical protein H206_00972 [Candidatus Electrothrix aarhusensis]
MITEVDLDNLMRAKGAMYAGYQTLLESVGLGFNDLDRVIMAGNFGAILIWSGPSVLVSCRMWIERIFIISATLYAGLPDKSFRCTPFL